MNLYEQMKGLERSERLLSLRLLLLSEIDTASTERYKQICTNTYRDLTDQLVQHLLKEAEENFKNGPDLIRDKNESPPLQEQFSETDRPLDIEKGVLDPLPPGKAICYTDGSYLIDSGAYGYGVVFRYGDALEQFGEGGQVTDGVQYTGEIQAAMAAISRAMVLEIKQLDIYYDFNGVATMRGENIKNKAAIVKEYQRLYKQASENMEISYYHVKAHSGDAFNSTADFLAKREAQKFAEVIRRGYVGTVVSSDSKTSDKGKSETEAKTENTASSNTISETLNSDSFPENGETKTTVLPTAVEAILPPSKKGYVFTKGCVDSKGTAGMASVLLIRGNKKQSFAGKIQTTPGDVLGPEYGALLHALSECIRQGCTDIRAITNNNGLISRAQTPGQTDVSKSFYQSFQEMRAKANIEIVQATMETDPHEHLKEATRLAKDAMRN